MGKEFGAYPHINLDLVNACDFIKGTVVSECPSCVQSMIRKLAVFCIQIEESNN